MAKQIIPPTEINYTTAIDPSRPRFRKQYSINRHIPDKETRTTPSQTVPGMDMSISQMLQRTARGLPINSGQIPVYNGERLLPNWKKLDLIDRANVVQQAKDNVLELHNKIQGTKKRIAERKAINDAKLLEKQQPIIPVTNVENKQP